MRVLGFMSGTSLDGVDGAIIETDGERIEAFGPARLVAFNSEERAALIAATEDALRANGHGRPATFDAAERIVLDMHLRVAAAILDAYQSPIDLVGFHGQTVLHRPDQRLTIQLGDANALADALGVPVVADLRQADVAAGGQGAPLVPVYHSALADLIGAERPMAFLNIGGVANLTWLGRDRSMIAFDTGPGNGLIDLLVQSRGGARYDEGGKLAAAGQVNENALQSLLDSQYFRHVGPKSLDRYDIPLDAVAELSTPDAAATLTAFTAHAVRLGAEQLPERPGNWLVCGGGRHNPVLMAALQQELGHVESTDDRGLRGDFIEAEAMAFLAARATRGLPSTFPATTGVPAPMAAGRIYHPRQRKAGVN